MDVCIVNIIIQSVACHLTLFWCLLMNRSSYLLRLVIFAIPPSSHSEPEGGGQNEKKLGSLRTVGCHT